MSSLNLKVPLSSLMKKILSTITVLIYFTVTCGVMINFHYCMDRYSSFKLYAVADAKCDLCGMQMHSETNDCCRDEIKIIKLDEDQKTSDVVFSFYEVSPIEIVPSEFICFVFSGQVDSKQFNNHSPPLLTMQDTYLQNCVFRI